MAVSLRTIVPLTGASQAALDSVLRLNQLNATELSELDMARLNRLIAESFHAVTIDDDAAGHSVIACEVNREPPNPASDSFHEARGFQEVGRAELGIGKTVRYLTRHLAFVASNSGDEA